MSLIYLQIPMYQKWKTMNQQNKPLQMNNELTKINRYKSETNLFQNRKKKTNRSTAWEEIWAEVETTGMADPVPIVRHQKLVLWITICCIENDQIELVQNVNHSIIHHPSSIGLWMIIIDLIIHNPSLVYNVTKQRLPLWNSTHPQLLANRQSWGAIRTWGVFWRNWRTLQVDQEINQYIHIYSPKNAVLKSCGLCPTFCHVFSTNISPKYHQMDPNGPYLSHIFIYIHSIYIYISYIDNNI